jgi:hypothetical protein
MSESQKQLLKTMLFYDLQNHVLIELDRRRLLGEDTSELETVKKYMERRISDIDSPRK